MNYITCRRVLQLEHKRKKIQQRKILFQVKQRKLLQLRKQRQLQNYKQQDKIIILFYGNCQTHAILETLNLPNTFLTYHIPCYSENIVEENFTSIIKSCDIIITQPIYDNYRNKPYLSTSFILQNKKSNCKVIIFDSCYFNFYYFDLTYKSFNNNKLDKPCDYHYNKMIECYNNGYSVNYYIDNFVNNLDLKTSEELEQIAENSLTELHHRHINAKKNYEFGTEYIISTYEYIKQNYKDKLLFYSMNHPSKYVIQFICEQIVNILQIENTINYDVDVLASTKCILYKCLSKNINFDINSHNPITNGYDNIYSITDLYYYTYKEINLTQ
jgi:hypothetical protein